MENKEFIEGILKCFMVNTKYISKRYAFRIETPSASTIQFKTVYFGDWKDNLLVSYTNGDKYFRISGRDGIIKTNKLEVLTVLLSQLHEAKVKEHGYYLSNDYTIESFINNIMEDVREQFDYTL